MNFYLVTTKCGHVGKGMYMPIVFPVKAENGEEAALKARRFPRVKHDHKDAILGCVKATEAEFYAQIEINNNDPYLKATSTQEQSEFMDLIRHRLVPDTHALEKVAKTKATRKPNLSYQKAKYSVWDYEDYEDDFEYEDEHSGYEN